MRILPVERYDARHFEACAGLLARTRAERRAAFPLLPAGLSDPATARSLLERASEKEGFVVLGPSLSPIAFLFSERREDPFFGPAVTAGVDDWALSPDLPLSQVARLYAASFRESSLPAGSSGWLPYHRLLCPAESRVAEVWFRLGFGVEQVYAAARLEDLEGSSAPPPALELRRARAGDEETLAAFSALIASVQSEAPVWAGAPAAYLADIREGYRGLSSEPEALVLLAFRERRPVGFQAWFPLKPDEVDGATEGPAIELSVAATLPSERGSGIGRALTAFGVAEARREGYAVCLTDWRSANPFSSAFWPARGFKPFLYRLVRRLDPLAFDSGSGLPSGPADREI